MPLCAFLGRECTDDCCAARVIGSMDEVGATRIMCLRLVRENSFTATDKATVDADETSSPVFSAAQEMLMYR